MHNKEITVTRIAQSNIDLEGAKKWITEILGFEDYELPEIDPANGVTPAALIVMMAAKRCYLSFDVGKNLNLTKVRSDLGEYLENIFKAGHGCYDEETEVLTKAGWKFWNEVNTDAEFATLSKSGILEWHKPVRLIRYDYKGKMYRVESPQVDLLVTPNHKMLACRTTTKEGRERDWSSYKLIKAENLGHGSHSYLKTIPVKPDIYTNESLRSNKNIGALLGFAIGDGSLKSSSRLEFHLRRTRKIVWLQRECAHLDLQLIEDEENDKYSVILSDSKHQELFSKIYNEDKEKVIPDEVFETWDAQAKHFLFQGLMESDGSRSETGDIYDTTSKLLAGQIQILALQLGFAANISKAECYKDRRESFGDKPIYRLSFPMRCLKPEVNKFKDQVGKSYWVEDWEGEVFCAEVPNNTLYVRRNGKPVWSGNSVLEHVSFTYAIEGVSRVFTGEMNRHRAGVAISEGSMRYIRLDDLGFWMPDIFQNDDDTLRKVIPKEAMADVDIHDAKSTSRSILRSAFAQMEVNVAALCEEWRIEDPSMGFKSKKLLTSAFRRIIGMGVATGGTWTINVRALRHILTMRGEKEHAEEEIYRVANLIADDMVKTEPLLFGDFEKDHKTRTWKPKYPKV